MSDDAPDTSALAIARALIRCRSVTPADDGALDCLQALLSAHGFACHRLRFADTDTPEIDNLYARIGSEPPHLCFAGHTDVVPPGNEAHWTVPPFAGTVAGGALYGRGAVDMKGGIAAFAAAALDYLAGCDGRPPGSISFLITGDEEGPAINGTQKVLRWAAERGERIDHCIVGEPTSPARLGETIKIGRRGSLSGTLTVHGRQGHVAYPRLADNPVPKLVRLLARLLARPLDEGSDHFQPSNIEVIALDANSTAWNVIPGTARARFNIRFNDRWTTDSLRGWLAARLDEEDGGAIDYALDYEPGASEAFLTGPCDLTDLLTEAVRAVTGVTPDLSTSGGTSDARFIKDYAQVVEFGLVGQTMHQTDEHVRLADLDALTAIYRRVIEAYFGRFAGGKGKPRARSRAPRPPRPARAPRARRSAGKD